jgi:predicted acylesterase/phospholipase RssA
MPRGRPRLAAAGILSRNLHAQGRRAMTYQADLVIGASIGAIGAAYFAADPTRAGVEQRAAIRVMATPPARPS